MGDRIARIIVGRFVENLCLHRFVDRVGGGRIVGIVYKPYVVGEKDENERADAVGINLIGCAVVGQHIEQCTETAIEIPHIKRQVAGKDAAGFFFACIFDRYVPGGDVGIIAVLGLLPVG